MGKHVLDLVPDYARLREKIPQRYRRVVNSIELEYDYALGVSHGRYVVKCDSRSRYEKTPCTMSTGHSGPHEAYTPLGDIKVWGVC
jgi:hypothetical protein